MCQSSSTKDITTSLAIQWRYINDPIDTMIDPGA